MSWSVQDWPRFPSGTKGNPEHPASAASKPYRPWAVDFLEISLFDILSFRFFSVPLQAVLNQAVIPAPVFACVFVVATLTMVVNAVFRRST